jgi:hypothetical protein
MAGNEVALPEDVTQAVCKMVYRRFPAVREVKPKVTVQRPSQEGSEEARTYLLAFHSQVKLNSGKSLPYWVRVVVGRDGEIHKISTSR